MSLLLVRIYYNDYSETTTTKGTNMNRIKAAVSTITAITFTAAAGVGAIVLASPKIFKGSYNYFRGINGLDDFDADDWGDAVTRSFDRNLKPYRVHTNM